MVSRARSARLLAAALTLIAALCAAPSAMADLAQLTASCSASGAQIDAADDDPADGFQLPYRFCDDGVPTSGGTDANATGDKAVEVPAAYTGAVGLPGKDSTAAAAVPGANAAGNVALDVDISLPDPATNPMPAGGYPLVVMMHGCCSGSKVSWESKKIDGGGSENWHYNNAWFASRGYVVITYTARGFVNGSNDGSTGQTQLDSSRFEINDYQHLAGQVGDLADIDPVTGGNQTVDASRVVPTGGSYGGGFSWMALTDPEWQSPGGKAMKVVAVGTKYGWTNLVESLVPRGDDLRDQLPETDADVVKARLRTAFGFPKRTINNALYLSGKLGFPTPNGPHTTFPPDIDEAQTCLSSTDPYEQNPLCANVRDTSLPRFIDERSAYFQTAFFDGLRNGAIDPVPVFSAGTFTDKLFTAAEHRRMVERLKLVASQRSPAVTYPVQEHYGDYNHFVQNKRKEWADLCGADRHVCAYEDYPGGDLDAAPPTLAREHGVTTRLNRFIDHYAEPPANAAEPKPDFDVTGSLQVCPENVDLNGGRGDEPGPRFTAATFDALAPNTLTITAAGAQPTLNNVEPNPHAVKADPVANTASNSSRCPVESSPGGVATAGPGVATYTSDPLPSDFTMLGMTRALVAHTGAGAGLQLNARLYDLYPDDTQVMVDRGVKRLSSATGPTTLDLHGAGWRFPKGHRVRIELAQDDDPYIKSSNQPGSLVIASAKLEVPIREASTAIGGSAPAAPAASAPGGSRDAPDDDEPADDARPRDDTGSPDAGPASDLPFTGFQLLLAALTGAGLAGAGLGLRRRLRSR